MVKLFDWEDFARIVVAGAKCGLDICLKGGNSE
jgi:hypothetical protein